MTTNQVNADGTLNVFLAARATGVARVVYASSSAVYGDSPEMPRREGNEGAPLSPYALTKVINESYGRLFRELYGVETIGLRYFNIFGPRQDPSSRYAAVIPLFVKAILAGESPVIFGDGAQSRDFTYVKDVVKANLMALEAPSGSTGSAYNVGRGANWTILELLGILQELLGTDVAARHDPPRAGDVKHSSADMTITTNRLGFSADYDLREGLELSIEWYKRYL
jgi:nucleoside-diphosphate-sugar epimerase